MEKDPRTIQFPKNLQGLLTMDQAIDQYGITRGSNWSFEDDPQKDKVIKDIIDYYNAENSQRLRRSYGELTQKMAQDFEKLPWHKRKFFIQMMNNKFDELERLGYDPTYVPKIIDRGDLKISKPAPVDWGPYRIIQDRKLVEPIPLTGIKGEALPDEAITIANAIKEEIQANIIRKTLRKSGFPDIVIEKILQATKTSRIPDQVRTYTPDKGLSKFYRTAMLNDKVKKAWGSSPRVELKGGKKKRSYKKKRSSKKKRSYKKKRSSKKK